ncbi:MAG: type II toxin-antitoxin system HicB family antitoxin [Alphaproteobacteria bacterium]|nr:type II toxin-antitoxin system HicB family antitoxin [Alphaproteobacteria bacterium]
MKYLALFILPKEGKSSVGVVFPDIPDCYTSGENIDHAYKMAIEILNIRLDDIRRAGKPLPKPRNIGQIKDEWQDWNEWTDDEEYAFAFVSYVPTGKPSKYTVYMNDDLMSRIDEVTNNRSAFLSKAAEMLLDYNQAE